MSDPTAVAEAILRAGPESELHWTVIWDRALRAGDLPPNPDSRAALQRALADGVKAGLFSRASTGTYRLPATEGTDDAAG